MVINYETDVRPDQLLLQIKYSSDGYVDVYRNLNNVTDFSESNVNALVEQHKEYALNIWNNLDNVVTGADNNSGTVEGRLKVYSPVPEYNNRTHKLEEVVSENEMTINITYNIVELTSDEIKVYQIEDAKQYLNETDYKVLPDYDGDTTGIIEARAEARALIRSLEG